MALGFGAFEAHGRIHALTLADDVGIVCADWPCSRR